MAAKHVLNNREIAHFCSQTAMLFHAGITPVESMELLLTDAKTTDGNLIYQSIYNTCSSGESFYNALLETDVFPDYVLNMVSLGETSGNLDVVMQSLADYYEREETISESIKEAIRYPFIMVVMMFAVIIVLITRVLPVFQQVFLQLGSDMSGLSLSLLHFGNRINQYFLFLLTLIIILFVLFFAGKKIAKFRNAIHKFWYVFPLTKDFYHNIDSERFASGMALAFSSGLDTFQSLDLTINLVDNPIYKVKIEHCKEDVENGSGLIEALSEAKLFSNFYNRMLAIGWRTGSADVVMKKIADDYDKKTTQKIQAIISVVEPTLVIVLSIIIGMILLSVIMPLLGIMSSIG